MSDIFVTGATGVIGSELVQRLLNAPDVRLHLLIRGDDRAGVDAKFSDLRAYVDGALGDTDWTRVSIYRGDTSQPSFGLPATVCSELGDRLTHIVHCAGNVKLNQTWEQAQASALRPAQHLLDFASRLRRLEKIEYVSTIGVAGRMPGPVPERELSEPRAFHNNYERAKAAAESLVFGEMGRLPMTIHRPSMVVGNSATGRVRQFQVFYYLCEFLSGRQTGGFVCDTRDKRLDTVPVDAVAEIIDRSRAQPSLAGRVVHSCAGEAALRISEIGAAYVNEMVQRGERMPTPFVLGQRFARLLARGIACVPMGPGRRARRLNHFLDYLSTVQTFDNENGRSLLGLTTPDPPGYLNQVLNYWIQHRR